MAVSGRSGRLLTIAQTVGVAVTGWLVWSDAVLPRLRWETAADLAAQAFSYVILAWTCAAAITFAVYFVVSLADFPEALRFSLRSAAPAMWFAPAVILALTPIPAAFLVSAVLVVIAAGQLVLTWAPPAAIGYVIAKPMIAMLASAAAQLGLVAHLWRRPVLASALFAGSTAIVTSLALSSGAYQPAKRSALPPALLSIVMAFALAVSLSFGGLRVRLAGGGSQAEGSPGAQNVTKANEPPPGNLAMDGDFPGVILLPELKPQATLLLPPPLRPGLLNAPITMPVGIPFSGEYWMFRWPAQRPPARSFVRRGTPAELSFHTTDGWPLRMEANQHLDPPADPRCCSRMQLVITDAENNEAVISIELVLADTKSGDSQSLGSASAEPGRFEQTLTYFIPRVTSLHSFDEIKLIFHRYDTRPDKSSKIAIERFVLLP